MSLIFSITQAKIIFRRVGRSLAASSLGVRGGMERARSASRNVEGVEGAPVQLLQGLLLPL